jgi:uncharacterized protein
MKKRILFIVLVLVLMIGIPIAGKSIREAHYPLDIQPSAEWEPSISALDVQREAFFVESDGIKLEAELFIPHGGSDQKPAVVFSAGSGDSLYQNYAWGFIETFILDVFLQNDIAVLLVNKRGMGSSQGNYVKNSIPGRAEDIYAAVQSIQTHPKIDPAKIGLLGHSQGGWVVTQAAADHSDIAFFISIAGPTMSMRENASDNAYHAGICQGMQDEDLEAYIEKRSDQIDVSMKIGERTNFGMFGFDARNMGYDPRNAIGTVQNPGLFIYAEHDDQVTPSINIDRMNEIFDNNLPEHIGVITIDGSSHAFRLVSNPCESWVNPEEQKQSKQLIEVLNQWLEEQGF